MKIKELIEQLSQLDPEMEIVMSKDAEGNDYSPLSDMAIYNYVPTSTWRGDVYSDEDVDDLLDCEDWDSKPDNMQRVVCFWPVN